MPGYAPSMKIFHSSDWHIGRTFHTHPTLDHFRIVAQAMAALVVTEHVDVVVVAGDIFDSAMPAADAYTVLGDTLRALRSAGAQVVLTSGNHDSATRLGFQSEWARLAGIHVLTRHESLDTPVVIDDDHGPVHFFGIPYLEPALIRHSYPDVSLSTHEQALSFAMQRIRSHLETHPARSVALAHCFAASVRAEVDVNGPERDIIAGGLNLVAASVFDGPDYVALGHIHGRAEVSERVRYSGAPLHYSFSEANKARGGWMVTLDAAGLGSVVWHDLPVPRPLAEISGTLEHLLTAEEFAAVEGHWVKANLTDRVRPLDAMRRLQSRFENCVALEYRPPTADGSPHMTYSERTAKQTDAEIVAGFVEYVRNGVGPSEFESRLLAELLIDTPAPTRGGRA